MPVNLLNLDALITPAAQYGSGPGGWGGHMMYGWGGWLGGPFMMVFWILLIVAGVALVKWLFSMSRKDQAAPLPPFAQPQDRSLSILRERYAKGEISTQEYQAMRAELGA